MQYFCNSPDFLRTNTIIFHFCRVKRMFAYTRSRHVFTLRRFWIYISLFLCTFTSHIRPTCIYSCTCTIISDNGWSTTAYTISMIASAVPLLYFHWNPCMEMKLICYKWSYRPKFYSMQTFKERCGGGVVGRVWVCM